MANWCSFKMMVRGESKNVDTFYGYLTDYENSPRYFARIFNAEKDSESIEELRPEIKSLTEVFEKLRAPIED